MARVGKRKDGTYGNHITFSMLFNAANGRAIGYSPFAGNEPNTKALDALMVLLKDFEIGNKEPVVIVDCGYYNYDRLVKLLTEGPVLLSEPRRR